jgi:hypothetical protein
MIEDWQATTMAERLVAPGPTTSTTSCSKDYTRPAESPSTSTSTIPSMVITVDTF